MNKKTYFLFEIKQKGTSKDKKQGIVRDDIDVIMSYQKVSLDDLHFIKDRFSVIINNEIANATARKKKKLQQENENRRLQNQLEVKKNPSGIVINSKKM